MTFNRALIGDLALYALSAVFAWLTVNSSLVSHRPWGAIAAVGYAIATLVVLYQLFTRRAGGRTTITFLAWGAVCLVPLIYEAVQRAHGHGGSAQDEVTVIEQSGLRVWETGTPFLDRANIAKLSEPLLGYMPYQPAMAVFGLPKAIFGTFWLTDARIFFALVTALCLHLIFRRTTPSSQPPSTGNTWFDQPQARAIQAVTVLPIAALTLATGGDDLPVLALTLLGLVYLARAQDRAAGVAFGIACALKLFAWPVALVVLLTRPTWRLVVPLIAIPVLTALPTAILSPGAFVENVIEFPLGHGLVNSPATSPLPGYLMATYIPKGQYIALILLGLAGLACGWWILRRRPRTAHEIAAISAVGMVAAISLMPATRFGYLLYPAAYALWIAYLHQLTPVRPRANSVWLSRSDSDLLDDSHVNELG